MAITAAVRTALRELESEDGLLHAAMSDAIQSCTMQEYEFNGIAAYRALLSKLRTYDRGDIRWHLQFMRNHHELRKYWFGTIIRLSTDQFKLHLDRLDDLWERICVPGMDRDAAWNVLVGYPDGDPGTKRSHANSVFLINAALISAIKQREANYRRENVTVERIYHGPHAAYWTLEELTPELAAFAMERAADADRIVRIIMDRNTWQPEGINYYLDGTLPSEGPEAVVLGNALITELCTNAEKKLELALAPGGFIKHMDEAETRKLVNSHYRSSLGRLAAYQRSGDTEALKLNARLIPSSLGTDHGYHQKSLETTVQALRDIGHNDLENTIDFPMVNRVGSMNSALAIDEFDKESTLYSERRSIDQQMKIELALRGAAALGSPEVATYISDDYQRAMNLAVQYNVTTHLELLAVIEERLEHGALGNGVL